MECKIVNNSLTGLVWIIIVIGIIDEEAHDDNDGFGE